MVDRARSTWWSTPLTWGFRLALLRRTDTSGAAYIIDTTAHTVLADYADASS